MTDTATTTPKRSRVAFQKRRKWINRATWAVTLAAAAAAVFAPASLTGDPLVDMVERAVFAAVVAYAAAHGHRWSWFVGAGFILVPARGVSLVLVVLATLAAMWATTRTNRPKHVGALVGGLLANACLWYTDDLNPVVIAACAVVGSTFLVVSGFRSMRAKPRQTTMVPLVTALVIVVLGVIGVIVGGLLTVSDLTAGTADARAALASVENGDTTAARASLDSAQDHLDRADRILGPSILAARLVPSLSQHVDALDVALTESRRITLAADDLLASADYENLRYQGRVDVEQIAALAPGAAHVHRVLSGAEARLDDTRAAWLVSPLRDRIEELHTEVADVKEASDLASQVLDVAPGLFGAQDDRRYLVAFFTPAELRGGGGFLGSYAELLARDGRVELVASGPIKDLINHGEFGEREITGPAEYLRRYGRFQTADYIQDVPYSPHFPHNAQVLAELYPQAGGNPVDGVIGVDPEGLAALLELTGPVDVEGYDEPLSSENAADFLLRDQYLEFSTFDEEGGEVGTKAEMEDDRKDFLAEATKATFEELTRASLPAPAEIGRVLGPAARGRHLQVWSPRDDEQDLFERVEADGALVIPRGHDGFEVAQNNAGNNKIDAYQQRHIEYEAQVDPGSGRLQATLRITLHNDLPTISLPSAVIGNRAAAEGGTNITWLSIFTPHQVVGATLDGERLSLGSEKEVGLYAYDTPFIHIPPMGSVTVELQLEGVVALQDGYHLTMVPQPVANPDVVTAEVTTSSGRFTGPDADGGVVVHEGQMPETVALRAEIE